ncbi:Lon protease family protein [Flocculibacter collagenilyticus]|uniref:Lon protease family protein n=1 Tax=Flocculibacter collagenilyticus TaxID=2744479 RepID=UPI0018F5C03F|nr:ATP-binding protein [Flocculibacter collagenilyticus]
MTTTQEIAKLKPAQLKPNIELNKIEASLASQSQDPVTFIGQKRAKNALGFGLGMDFPGYNVYVMGESALGRFTLVNEQLSELAKTKETPHEWCYVNNFEDERCPQALMLSPGDGKGFCNDISALIDEIVDTFPAAFDNPSYQRRKKAFDRHFNQKYDNAIASVEKKAMEHGVVLYEEKGSITFAPVIDGKPIDDTQFANLPDDKRQYYFDLIDQLEEFLNEQLLELPGWKRELSEGLRKLRQETIEQAIRPLLKDLEHKYNAEIGILQFLKKMQDKLLEHIMLWLPEETENENKDEYDVKAMFVDEYMPNLLFHYDLSDGAPIIYEPNPTYQNIFGRIEYSSIQGSIFTNYRKIRTGALHKANGGYLVIEADKVMSNPYVWEALKLALQSHKLTMEPYHHDIGMVSSITLSPQPIPLDVKIILLGSRQLYYMMEEYDDEFNELFRVLADFEHEIHANDRAHHEFIQKILQYVEQIDIDEISPCAIARLLEFSFRQAEHQHKLSARFADVLELINEACYFSLQDECTVIKAEHVEEALQGKQYRTGQISESILDDIKEGHILIDTESLQIGKANGLTVLEIGDTRFGTPARISATVYAGANGIIDIEREVDLGKSIHSKGVMLLTGYLGNKYTQEFPLTVSANIALEQSYGHIDGDSASLGEVCALISAITQIPIDQSLAVTGSINQHGEVQAVGGVNEKIEGFFKLCKSRGLTKKQGVIIPKANHVNLVLSEEVATAVEQGAFNVFVVETVDQALELLMNHTAGEITRRGTYPKNTVNYIALQRLKNIADAVTGGEAE